MKKGKRKRIRKREKTKPRRQIKSSTSRYRKKSKSGVVKKKVKKTISDSEKSSKNLTKIKTPEAPKLMKSRISRVSKVRRESPTRRKTFNDRFDPIKPEKITKNRRSSTGSIIEVFAKKISDFARSIGTQTKRTEISLIKRRSTRKSIITTTPATNKTPTYIRIPVSTTEGFTKTRSKSHIKTGNKSADPKYIRINHNHN